MSTSPKRLLVAVSSSVGVALAFALAIVACKETSSTGLATSDIRADMSVHIDENDPQTLPGVGEAGAPATDGGDAGAPESGSFMAVDLYKDDSITEVIDLGAGDSMYVATNLAPNTPLPRGLPGFYDTPHLDLKNLSDATFVLTRANGTPAPSSKVSVPAAIAVTAPKQDDTISAAGGKITFTWSNPVAGSKVYVYAHQCGAFSASGSTDDITVADTGSYDLAWSKVPGGPPTSPTCFLVQVVRIAEGTPDPAWHKGSFVRAYRTFWMTFTGTP